MFENITNNVTTIENLNCKPKFRVICNYELLKSDASGQMTPDLIPFEKCDEIVIEELILDSKGEIIYENNNEYAPKIFKNLVFKFYKI